MNYSTTYLAVIINILSFVLPKIGISIGSAELTTTVQTLVTLGTGLYILIERYRKGGVSVAGFKKA